MASRYKEKPSEILGIENDLLAFMIDEFSMYLEMELMDEKGNINWDKLGTKSKLKGRNDNQAMMEHIEKHRKGPNVTVR